MIHVLYRLVLVMVDMSYKSSSGKWKYKLTQMLKFPNKYYLKVKLHKKL